MHRVEAEAGGRLTGPALVARLMKAQSQLDDLPERKRVYWSLVLNDLLQGSPHTKLRNEEVAQAILHNLLTELYDARDTKFTNLATQQNKVTWMVFTGLAIMAALVSQGYEDLLMAGAVGGILSRLQRELDRRDVPSDYGLSWSVLFLSPVSGALSAWAGLLLLQALQQVNVFDLSTLLPANTDLTNPTGAILGVAIVFGFTERLLDRIVRQATEEIGRRPSRPKRSRCSPSRRPPPGSPRLRHSALRGDGAAQQLDRALARDHAREPARAQPVDQRGQPLGALARADGRRPRDPSTSRWRSAARRAAPARTPPTRAPRPTDRRVVRALVELGQQHRLGARARLARGPLVRVVERRLHEPVAIDEVVVDQRDGDARLCRHLLDSSPRTPRRAITAIAASRIACLRSLGTGRQA